MLSPQDFTLLTGPRSLRARISAETPKGQAEERGWGNSGMSVVKGLVLGVVVMFVLRRLDTVPGTSPDRGGVLRVRPTLTGHEGRCRLSYRWG
ncbi:hypothetical protein GCM10023082_01220 [Streptomyces tremellae]|uniref:Uncharacterized protein n=1 Tax=Streptomyces tremellae TaxID=1124239 RepID=A0ABP7DNU9_9ACTN